MQLGDVVILKSSSNGPFMTVAEMSQGKQHIIVRCCWLDENEREIKYKNLPANVLSVTENNVGIEEIAEGDVVQLKSGGQLMTVDVFITPAPGLPLQPGFRCHWFDGSDYRLCDIPRELLKKHVP